MASIAQGIVRFFNPQSIIYVALYFLLTVGFTYFYTAFTFKPDETAEQLRKNGGFIPGIRPGRPTADYLARVVTRITIAGALFLGIIATAPSVVGLLVPALVVDRPRRNGPADRRQRGRRDDEADRGPAPDAQLRRLHPMTASDACGEPSSADDRGRAPRRAGRRQGDPGADPRRDARGADPRVRRPAPGGRRRRHAARPRGRSLHEPRPARARTTRSSASSSTASSSPTPAAARSSTASRGRASRPRRSIAPSPSAGRRVDRAIFIDVADGGPRPPDVQPPDLHGQRPRLQPRVEPAARRRASATSTARSSSSGRTTTRRRSARG